MFPKVALILAATMAALVAASPLPGGGSACNSGSIHCCEESYSKTSAVGAAFSKSLPIGLQELDGYMGFNCAEIAGIGGILNSKCKQQTLCCSDTTQNGLVVLGCNNV